MVKKEKSINMLHLPEIRTPRWVIILLDLLVFLFALGTAYLMRFEVYSNTRIIEYELNHLLKALPVLILVKLVVFYLFKIHSGLIRYTSFEDIRRLFFAVATSSIAFLVIGLLRAEFIDGRYLIPTSVLFMEFFTSLLFLIGLRFAIKVYYYETTKPINRDKSILIYGAGVSGLITKRTIEKDPNLGYKVEGFIDDNKQLVGNRLEGVKIYASSKIESLIEEFDIAELIVAIQRPEKEKTNTVIDACLKHDVEVKSVPNFKNWIDGSFSVNQIRKINIEDLLGRKPIVLDEAEIKSQLNNKTILVTGAAGSIGSGIVHQLCGYNPSKILLLDQAESAIYDFHNELISLNTANNVEVAVGDIRNELRMRKLFEVLKPDVVFHAAAYKHVPLMEGNPTEAVHTNVLGTKILVDLADEFGIKKFVMISTDKAVNPTNVMGASKRIAEIYAQYKNEISKTQYVNTRFGNVLGSNGSVIPLFKKQIERGGPITVTHKDVTRYFMTIPEACQLVLDAGAMGNGGEIFVFDMGKSIKIVDLAEKMIKLSGLKLNEDIQIKYTGLRPGEKLYEELLANDENTIPTHHPQILKARQIAVLPEEIKDIEVLVEMLKTYDVKAIVSQMKKIVPEYISNNSEFSKLDKNNETS